MHVLITSCPSCRFFNSTRRQLGDLLRVRHPKAGAIVVKLQPALASARGKLQLCVQPFPFCSEATCDMHGNSTRQSPCCAFDCSNNPAMSCSCVACLKGFCRHPDRAPSGVHVKRTPGVAVFYDDSIYGVPHALVQLVSPDQTAAVLLNPLGAMCRPALQ